jgi:hypothetical protein
MDCRAAAKTPGPLPPGPIPKAPPGPLPKRPRLRRRGPAASLDGSRASRLLGLGGTAEAILDEAGVELPSTPTERPAQGDGSPAPEPSPTSEVAEEAEEEEAEAADAEAEEEAAEAEAEEEEGDEDVMPGSYSYLKNDWQRASTRPYGLPVGP